MSPATHHFYDFGDFRLDLAERVLIRGGKHIPVTPKVYETLLVLIENAGRIIEKNELMQKIWCDRFVEESNLTFNIKMLRKALGDDAAHPRYVETVPRRGYRFIHEVKRIEAAAEEDAETRRRGNAETKIRLSTDSPSPNFPISRSPRLPVSTSRNGVVVALADWRHETNRDGAAEQISPATAPGESIEQAAGLESIPAKLTGESKFAPKYRLPLAAFALAALLVGAGVLGYYFSAGKSAGADGKKSIAVLPVKPINAANRDEIYEVGIADSLIYRLSSMQGFVVRPLSATRKYADIEQDALTAGREQRADYVLASNYQLAGGKIRLTTQLFNVASGQIEDTYKSEKEATNVFAMQDEIAVEVGNLLQKRFAIAPSETTIKRGTTNEEAYRLYLQGMYLVEKMGFANAKRSIELFDEALRLDPNYAQAWAGKARAHCYFSHVGGNSPDAQYTQAKPALERAFALDPNLPEAHAVLGVIKIDYDWDFAAGEKQFLRAIEIAPTCEIAHRWYANRLAAQGRSEEAIARIKTAIDLNPNYVFNQILYGRALYFARRYDEAVIQLQRAGEMDSAHPGVYYNLWRSYYMKGDYPRAYESFIKFQQLIGTNDETLRSYETSYMKSGWQEVLLRHLEIRKANAVSDSDAYEIAALSAILGQREQSFRYLHDAVKNRSAAIPAMVSDPALDSLRDDSRFSELVKRTGLK